MDYNDDLENYFSDDDNCMKEIRAARGYWNTKATRPGWEQMMKTLGIMLCHCSADVRPLVESTIFEAQTRGEYMQEQFRKFEYEALKKEFGDE